MPLPWPPQDECGHKNVERPLKARPGAFGSGLNQQAQTSLWLSLHFRMGWWLQFFLSFFFFFFPFAP